MINEREKGSRDEEEMSSQAKPGVPHGVAPDGSRREGSSSHEDTMRPPGRDRLRTINTWSEGVRRVLCLNCDSTFESESKIQRLCQACRAQR